MIRGSVIELGTSPVYTAFPPLVNGPTENNIIAGLRLLQLWLVGETFTWPQSWHQYRRYTKEPGNSVVSLGAGYGLGDPGVARPILGPTLRPMKLELSAPSTGVERIDPEAYLAPPSNVEAKNTWLHAPIPPIHLRGVLPNYFTFLYQNILRIIFEL
jgi:hypothetical protein